MTDASSSPRKVYMILSSSALPYAIHAVDTLFQNCLEPLDFTLVTDDADDKARINDAVGALASATGKTWRAVDMTDCDAAAETVFKNQPNIRAFRQGHPCWRKITDPLLFSGADEEAIILDPDLYFPNRFTFEPTQETGIRVMYQGPNCLFPRDAVETAFNVPLSLADHVDIGAAQLRVGALDFDWLDWLVKNLEHERFTPFMHIEAIVWSAMAMKMGGGYYDPAAWRCWQRGHVKRVAIAAGAPGPALLRMEPLASVKCIHVSGPSKWWVVDAIEKGALATFDNTYDQPSPIIPFQEYPREKFEASWRMKDLARKLGYYKLTKSE